MSRYGFKEDEFFSVPSDVASAFGACKQAGAAKHAEWSSIFERYREAHPELAAEFERRQAGKLPEGWRDALPTWTPEDKPLATRQASQMVLNKLAEAVPELVGGSADLTPSNLTKFRGALDFQASTPEGRYIRFGVREHAMAAVCNGLAAWSPALVPFCATFLNFTGYALGAMRVSALSEHGVLYVATHDSIGLGCARLQGQASGPGFRAVMVTARGTVSAQLRLRSGSRPRSGPGSRLWLHYGHG